MKITTSDNSKKNNYATLFVDIEHGDTIELFKQNVQAWLQSKGYPEIWTISILFTDNTVMNFEITGIKELNLFFNLINLCIKINKEC